MRHKPVIAIIGPTGVGKTVISLGLAEKYEGEIVSADSRLVYRGMNIGTAKPTLAEQKRVRHHLIDVVEPADEWNLAKYQSEAGEAIENIHKRERVVFLVGGTGQYLTAILEGWTPPPRSQDVGFRTSLERQARETGHEILHRQLKDIDPIAAEHIDARNVRRVIRALEIHHVTGLPPSQIRIKSPPDFDVLKIGLILPRDQLYARIDARIEEMMEAGWLDEVKTLLSLDIPQGAPSMSAIGYAQLAEYLRGDVELDEALAETRRLTRQFIRRQANWFKPDDPSIRWFVNDEDVAEEIESCISTWLDNEPTA